MEGFIQGEWASDGAKERQLVQEAPLLRLGKPDQRSAPKQASKC